MGATAVPAAEPTTAEQVRSVLARADSLTMTTDGHRYDLVGLHTVDERGYVGLDLPADSPPAAQAAYAPRGALAALLEFTDVAPTAVRDRVRARVTLSGWLTPLHPPGTADRVALRLDTARATLTTASGTVAAGLDEMVLAAADPLAEQEAALLTHLADAHPHEMARLTRLVDPRHLHGVLRVWPLALDRHGLVLRLEQARGHRDVRLAFRAPAHDAAQAGDRIQELLAATRTCGHRRRLLGRS
jgi:hypothetical protein